MKTIHAALGVLALGLIVLSACRDAIPESTSETSEPSSTTRPAEGDSPKNSKNPPRDPREPDRVEIRICVLPCEGGRLGFAPRPSVAEARADAESLIESVTAGQDLEAKVVEISADPDAKSTRGVRTITNWGVVPDLRVGERPRSSTPALSAAVFKAKVGEVGMVAFDAEDNPLGFVVYQRLR